MCIASYTEAECTVCMTDICPQSGHHHSSSNTATWLSYLSSKVKASSTCPRTHCYIFFVWGKNHFTASQGSHLELSGQCFSHLLPGFVGHLLHLSSPAGATVLTETFPGLTQINPLVTNRSKSGHYLAFHMMLNDMLPWNYVPSKPRKSQAKCRAECWSVSGAEI